MQNTSKDTNIIELKNIYVYYESLELIPVLKNINLPVHTGEHWAVLGANGSGKTTLIKLLSNDLYPNPKHPFVKKIFDKERWSTLELKQNLGIITNDLHNYFAVHGGFLTAYEVVLSGHYSAIGIFKHQDFTDAQHENALEILKYLDISNLKEKKVYQMSTGELRRCIIGRALVHNPKAFILDEPTVGLDIKSQHSFLQLIRKISKNATIILVTHHIEEIFKEISHVAVMKEGEIFKQGEKKEILTSENLSEAFDIEIKIEEENDRYYIKSIT